MARMNQTLTESEPVMLPMWIKEIVPLLDAAEGFTIHPDTGLYTGTGYSVGIYPERERRFVKPVTNLLAAVQEVLLFAHLNRDLLARPDHYIGGWQAEDQLVLDIAVVTASRPEAERLGMSKSQAAYYAFETADSHQLYSRRGERV